MTWREWKEWMAQQGVQDDDEILYIDAYSPPVGAEKRDGKWQVW